MCMLLYRLARPIYLKNLYLKAPCPPPHTVRFFLGRTSLSRQRAATRAPTPHPRRPRPYARPVPKRVPKKSTPERSGRPVPLCGFIASDIHLYAFIHSGFSNLRKSLARCCIHISSPQV